MKRIAEEVMLRSVVIDTLDNLVVFARKVVHGAVARGPATREPGHMIRRLYIACLFGAYRRPDFSLADPTPWAASLVTILMASPFLQLFALDAVPMTCVVIECLAPHSHGCLTSLRFRVSFDRERPDGVLAHVNQLQALEQLDITFDESINHELDVEIFEGLEALTLPGVRRFAWHSDFMGEADADYLARCRVHPACSIFIERFEYESDVSTNLAPFFAAHSFTSAALHLTEDTLAGLASHIVAIDSVKLLNNPPPPELLQCGRLPAQLKINIQLDNDEDEDDAEYMLDRLWDFLSAIPPLSARGSRVTELSVVIRARLANPFKYTGREFRWSDITNEKYTAFIKQLAKEAIRLYEEGVVIIDETGRNVMQRAD
jgi:hypothetical protein